MNITEVPRVLFQEISQKLGKGDERRVSTNGFTYLMKELDPAENAAGFPGAIGFREDQSSQTTYFGLWSRVPLGKDDISEPKPVINIRAGPEDAGVWMYGSGRKMKEMAVLDVAWHGISLRDPGMKLIPKIIQRASELVFAAESQKFWEKERHPDRNYTRP